MVIKADSLAWSVMATPTRPFHAEPCCIAQCFGSFARPHNLSHILSQASVPYMEKLGVGTTATVANCRTIGTAIWFTFRTPHIEVDSETYEVHAEVRC